MAVKRKRQALNGEEMKWSRRVKELHWQIARQYLPEVGLSLRSSAYVIAMKQQLENGLTMES